MSKDGRPSAFAIAALRFRDHWLRDGIAGLRLWLLHEGLRRVPTEVASAIGGRIACMAGPRFYGRADDRARALVQAFRPDLAMDEEALAATLARLWDCIGRTHAEFSAEDRLWAEGRVAVEGAEVLERVRASGRPLIVAGLHLGNWELLPIAVAYLGHAVIDVYQPQANRFVDRIAKRSRLRAAGAIARATERTVPEVLQLVAPSRNAGSELVRGLRAGYSMMMYVDEEVEGKVWCPAFEGVPADAGNLARVLRLAKLTGAVVVPGYVERTAGARFTVHFLPPLPDVNECDAAVATEALNASVAAAVRRHLDQWFMLLSYRRPG